MTTASKSKASFLKDAETKELLQPQHQGEIKEYSQANLQGLLVSSCLCKLTSEIIKPEIQISDNAYSRYIFFHADTEAERLSMSNCC